MSFAVSRGFGATHPLLALADRLSDSRQVAMGPLTTFYDGVVEDSEDIEKLALAWQDAAPLANSLRNLVAAVTSDEMASALLRRANAEGLPDQAEALAAALTPAVACGARVRLEYRL